LDNMSALLRWLQEGVRFMTEDSAITVFDESEPVWNSCAGGGQIIRLELDIFGEPVDLLICVENKQPTLADIVPLARAVSTKITDKVAEMVLLDGGHIPCRKGCSACCYYLVSLAVPEVFCLRQDTLAMPQMRRLSAERACLSAAQRILGQQPPDLFAEAARAGTADSAAELLNAASKWYADFKLPCPFLCKGICTIYEQRPMVCREHSVTGGSVACGGGAGEAQRIYIPGRMSEVLGRLASELEGTSVEALIMPFALIWADENQRRRRRRWPALMMVERFVEIVKQEISKRSAQVVASA